MAKGRAPWIEGLRQLHAQSGGVTLLVTVQAPELEEHVRRAADYNPESQLIMLALAAANVQIKADPRTEHVMPCLACARPLGDRACGFGIVVPDVPNPGHRRRAGSLRRMCRRVGRD